MVPLVLKVIPILALLKVVFGMVFELGSVGNGNFPVLWVVITCEDPADGSDHLAHGIHMELPVD